MPATTLFATIQTRTNGKKSKYQGRFLAYTTIPQSYITALCLYLAVVQGINIIMTCINTNLVNKNMCFLFIKETKQWAKVDVKGEIPAPRSRHTAAIYNHWMVYKICILCINK